METYNNGEYPGGGGGTEKGGARGRCGGEWPKKGGATMGSRVAAVPPDHSFILCHHPGETHIMKDETG